MANITTTFFLLNHTHQYKSLPLPYHSILSNFNVCIIHVLEAILTNIT